MLDDVLLHTRKLNSTLTTCYTMMIVIIAELAKAPDCDYDKLQSLSVQYMVLLTLVHGKLKGAVRALDVAEVTVNDKEASETAGVDYFITKQKEISACIDALASSKASSEVAMDES